MRQRIPLEQDGLAVVYRYGGRAYIVPAHKPVLILSLLVGDLDCRALNIRLAVGSLNLHQVPIGVLKGQPIEGQVLHPVLGGISRYVYQGLQPVGGIYRRGRQIFPILFVIVNIPFCLIKIKFSGLVKKLPQSLLLSPRESKRSFYSRWCWIHFPRPQGSWYLPENPLHGT